MKIAQMLEADAWGGVDEQSLDRGIGGREGALIRLAREWARLGHEVTNFVPTQKPMRIYEGEGFFEFVPFAMAQTCMATFPYDACVAWECPKVFADERVVERNSVRLLEMQCAHLGQADPLELDAAAEFCTGVVGLSQWHVDFMAHQEIEGPFYVLPNGVDLEHYPWRERKALPRNKRFFYSSSPDRGLWNLLKVWPYVVERWPNAELKIAYGAARWVAPTIWAHRKQGQVAVEISLMLQTLPGVEDVGVLSQRELAKLQLSSAMLAYPCDTIQPTETGCITVIESMAAGSPVVTTDCDCLAEEFSDFAMIDPLPFRAPQYMQAIESVLGDRKVYTELSASGREFSEGRQWKLIAPRWIELFEQQKSLS